jgi:hypothetical protein
VPTPSAGDGNDSSSCSVSGGLRKRRPDEYLDAKVRGSGMDGGAASAELSSL